MIFEKYLIPDEVVPSFRDVTPERLLSLGKTFVFSDIDNTLATYDDPTPPADVTEWCEKMTEAGITVAFVSNNSRGRVELFNEQLKYTAYAKARKPETKALLSAMRDVGATSEASVLLGDQLLTDAAAGKRAGLYCIIVPPIKDKTNLFFRFKRWLEIPYMRKYRILKGSDS